MSSEPCECKKWYMKVPHTFTILFLLIVLCAVATHFLPAGDA